METELIYALLSGAVCRRLTGGGVGDVIPKAGVIFLFGTLFYVLSGNPLIFLAATLGYAVVDLVGTGDMFAVIHGGYDGKREYSIWNRWLYKAADRLVGMPFVRPYAPSLKGYEAKFNAKWGFVFTTLRGSYKLVLSSLIALVALDPYIVLWGLLGFLDGVIYFLMGRFVYWISTKDTSIHEWGVASVTLSELIVGALTGYIVYKGI